MITRNAWQYLSEKIQELHHNLDEEFLMIFWFSAFLVWLSSANILLRYTWVYWEIILVSLEIALLLYIPYKIHKIKKKRKKNQNCSG